jgi:hypothetical protein
VAPRANFFWPRGWIAGMSPERSDLLEIVNGGMGREAPVGQAYYDEPWLGPAYRDSTLVARWGQRRLDGFALAPRGASFQAREFPLLVGDEVSRPVGVGVGRGGRVFAALSYMAGNEWSPKYPSELVMITRADDQAPYLFEPYDAPSADAARLWRELSHASWHRRQAAHVEILRRGGTLLVEAIARLLTADQRDPAMFHLPWLAAASRRPEAREALVSLAAHGDPMLRTQALRALGEFRDLHAEPSLFAAALNDAHAPAQHAAIVALAGSAEPLPAALFDGPAVSTDTYLRQASAFLLADRGTASDLDQLLGSTDARQRLAGVLAVGFRLTIPPAIGSLPESLPLKYESGNALFLIPYADATVDIRQLGRVGSFTVAERWKALPHSAEESRLFELLAARLSDPDDRVGTQAGYFLSLLDDALTNARVAEAARTRLLRRFSMAPAIAVAKCWRLGPCDDGERGLDTVHPPEQGAIDLSAPVAAGGRKLTWHPEDASQGFAGADSGGAASSYLYFRLQTLAPQQVLLNLKTIAGTRSWHNGRPVLGSSPLVLTLEPGSNDVLVRFSHAAQPSSLEIELKCLGRVEVTLPEKLGLASLAERLMAMNR